jgi:hypothetical protein
MGSMTNQYKQIGNAVPVNLAYAVAQQVRKALMQFKQNKTDTYSSSIVVPPVKCTPPLNPQVSQSKPLSQQNQQNE